MDITTLGAAVAMAKKVMPQVTAADAGKLATVDSNGKWAAADLEVGQGEVAVDSTLLVSGAAADAKVTGDKVAELKSAITELDNEIDDIGNAFIINESKNLLDDSDLTIGYVDTSTGIVNENATTHRTSGFVEIPASAVFSCGYNFTSLGTGRIAIYDAQKEYLSGSTVSLTEDTTLRRHYMVVQNNGSAKYMRISMPQTVWSNSSLKPQIESGTTPTAYVEYFAPEYGELKDTRLPDSIFDSSNPRKLLESSLPQSVPNGIQEAYDLVQDALYQDEITDYIVQFAPVNSTKIVTIPPATAGKIVHCGKNLFDQSQFLLNSNISYENGYYNGMGSYFASVLSDIVLPTFKPYKTYVISFTAYASANMQFKVGWKYTDGSTRWSSGVGTTETTIVWSSMPPAYKETGNGKTVTGIDFTWSTSGRIYIKDVQITESRDALTYEAFNGTIASFGNNTASIQLTAKAGENNVYCSTGKSTVKYFRNHIGLLDGINIVCCGDSITGNYTAPTDYPTYMHNYTGANVVNCGFGGTRMSLHTETAKQPFSFCSIADCIVSGDFSSMYAVAENIGIYNVYEHIYNLENTDFSKVDKMIIFYGTNDFTAQVPIDNQNDPDDTSTYLGAFRYAVDKILGEYPNIRIYAVTPMYRYFTDTSTDSDTQQYGGKYLYEFGNALIECARDMKLPSVDMYHISGVSATTKDYYLEDGTHPSQAGRKNIGQILGGALMLK